MRLPDIGPDGDQSWVRGWLQRLVEWSRKKITFEDNIDCVFHRVYLRTTSTKVGHPLGRTPRYIIEVAAYPDGTAGIQYTAEPTNTDLYLSRTSAGWCTLLLM